MLFAVKNHSGLTLLLAAAFAAAGLGGMSALGLPWPAFEWSREFGLQVAMGFGLIVLSDGVLQNALWLCVGEPYRSRYRALVMYFRRQGPAEIAAGGVLAGAEELVFRGLLMGALQGPGGLSAWAAILISAALFGALHLIPRRRLWPFALWAVWEGVLLGYVYHLTGSNGAVVVVHALHDMGGFAIFAVQRRTRCML